MPGINRCQYKPASEAINSHPFRIKLIEIPRAFNESPIIRHGGKLGNGAILISLAALMYEVSIFEESLVYRTPGPPQVRGLIFLQKNLLAARWTEQNTAHSKPCSQTAGNLRREDDLWAAFYFTRPAVLFFKAVFQEFP